jgi:hypothetical protein
MSPQAARPTPAPGQTTEPGQAEPVANATPAANASAEEHRPWRLDRDGWASLEHALVRPGSRIENERGTGCTANFLFTNPQGTKAYIGTAAHCFGVGADNSPSCDDTFEPLSSGDAAIMPLYQPTGAEVLSFPPTPTVVGRFVYSSFVAMQDAGESTDILCSHNDFALIELDDNTTRLANPAMWHWNGPTGLRSDKAVLGEHVFTFGGTAMRNHPADVTRAREGYVTPSERDLVDPDSDIAFHAALPGGCIGGDSGSPLTDDQDRAFGVVTRSAAGNSPSCRMAYLAPMLDYMAAHGGPEVVLASVDAL